MNVFARLKTEFNKRCPWGNSLSNWNDLNRGYSQKATAQEKAALKNAQEEYAGKCKAFAAELDGKIAALLPKIGKQALALIGPKPEPGFMGSKEDNHKLYAEALQVYHSKLETAAEAGPAQAAPVAAVPAKPAPTPAPKAAAPTHLVTAEALGREVLQTISHPDPKISKPAAAGLQAITKAAEQAKRPVLGFLKGLEKASLSMEFDKLGGLSASNHALYMYRRRQYCEQHHMTPEQTFGRPFALIPEIVETPQEARARANAIQDLDASSFAQFAIFDRHIAEAKDPASAAVWQERKAKAAFAWGQKRTELSKPAHLR